MYVVTGASGHTGTVIARNLLKNKAKVRVVGRDLGRLKSLAAEGAEAVSADVTDASSFTRALAGAKAAYVMVPPNISAPNVRAFQDKVTDATVTAVKNAGVSYVVSLSSLGADKVAGTGPIVGLHEFEEKLNQVNGLNALHLRASYFMENTLLQAGIIHKAGMTIGPLRPDLKLPMIATRDIGEAAAKALVDLNFHGKQAHELLGQRDLDMNEVTKIIGNAIAKPALNYVQAPDEQIRAAMLQMGMSQSMVDLILEMAAAWNSGHARALEPRSAGNTTATSYEKFVNEEFVPAYRGGSVAA